jgi:hypothetical protein
MPETNHVIKFNLDDQEFTGLLSVFTSKDRPSEMISVLRQSPAKRLNFLLYGSFPDAARPFLGFLIIEPVSNNLLAVSNMAHDMEHPLTATYQGTTYEVHLYHNGKRITKEEDPEEVCEVCGEPLCEGEPCNNCCEKWIDANVP